MQSTTDKIESTRADVVQAEQRIQRQRRRVEKLLVERHPADEAQAQLLIMEQSLISMTRFLKALERDLEVDDLSLQRPGAKRSAVALQGASETDAGLAKSPETAANHS